MRSRPDLDIPFQRIFPRALGWLSFVAALLLVAGPAAASRGPLIEKGLKQLKRGHFGAAEDTFKEAEAAEAGPCGECQLGLAMVHYKTGKWRKGEKAARAAIQQLEGHPQEHLAHGELGKICLERAKKKRSYWDCAENAFKAAVEISGGASKNSLFYLGLTQLKRSKDEEGVATMKRFVDKYPSDQYAEMARSFIEEPLRSRRELVPAFDWRTLNGGSVSSEDVAGKVVLLDFWATWCGPCRGAVPALRDIAEKHKDDPFMLVSLSVDRNESVIRDFVSEHSMKWPQVWDRERWGARNLEVSKFPTYVILGPDGEVIRRYVGGGKSIEQRLGREIAKAIKSVKK